MSDMDISVADASIIVVGGGASGCVVAGRLATVHPDLTILLVESGESNENMQNVVIPALAGEHALKAGSNTLMSFHSTPNPATNNRVISLVSGHILGGGGSVNFMGYSRPAASDFDDWKTPGWTLKELLPALRKCEKFEPWPNDPLHGYDGPLAVSYGGTELEIAKEWMASSQACGIPKVQDAQNFNTGCATWRWPKWIDGKTGKRADTAHAYIHSGKNFGHLRVLTSTQVHRVLIKNGVAVGVECSPTNADTYHPRTIRARKMVVLCAGTMVSPQLLERSGVGNPDILRKAGVQPLVDLPGVGENYQDHQLTAATYATDASYETMDDLLRGDLEERKRLDELFLQGKGGLATNYADAASKYRPLPHELESMGPDFGRLWNRFYKDRPDKAVSCTTCFAGFYGDHDTIRKDCRFFTTANYLYYPASRGSVHITSSDPRSAPDFKSGFLEHPADLPAHVWTYKRSREIARRMPCYRGEVPQHHPPFPVTSEAHCQVLEISDVPKYGFAKAACHVAVPPTVSKQPPVKDIKYSAEDDRILEDWVRSNVSNIYHYASTCSMKPRAQGGGVDERLNIFGVKKLKVADMSIIPENVGANTFGTAVMIGEQAAIIISDDLASTLSSKL